MNRLIFLIFLTVLSFPLFSAAYFISAPTTRPFPPKVGTGQEEIQVVISPKQTMLAAWTDDYTDTNNIGVRNCLYSVSKDSGKTWSQALIHQGTKYSAGGNPTVASDAQGNLYALCMSTEGIFKGTLDLSKSMNGGKTWSPWTMVYENTQSIPDKPWIVGDAQSLYLLFSDMKSHTMGNDEIIEGLITSLTSPDGGNSWFAPNILTKSGSGSQNGFQGSNLFVDGSGLLRASWGGYDGGPIFIAVSKDHGKTFSTPQIVSQSDILTPVTKLTGDPSGKHLFITWYEAHSFGKIYATSSDDGGVTWSSRQLITRNGHKSDAVFKGNLLNLTFNESKTAIDSNGHATGKSYLSYWLSDTFGKDFKNKAHLTTSNNPNLSSTGSYQTVVVAPDRSLQAFWLGDDGSIFQTSWKLQ